jgi:hypothetical protein
MYPDSCFRWADMEYCVDIISFAYEVLMGLSDMTSDIEISCSVFASMSFSSHSECHAIIDPCRYVDSLFDFFLYSAFTMTFTARIIDF